MSGLESPSRDSVATPLVGENSYILCGVFTIQATLWARALAISRLCGFGTVSAITLASAAGWSGTPTSGNETMSIRFANVQQLALSFAGALLFTALMVSAAVPVVPIA